MNAPAPRFQEPERHGIGFYVSVVSIIAIAIAGFLYTLPLISFQGASVTFVLGLLALVPVVLLLVLIRWIDQWEPEPRWLYVVAFAWGAGVSTLQSILGNQRFQEIIDGRIELDTYQQAALPVVVGAPLVEEAFKGIGVLLIFFVFSRYFNGAVDGIVYGMLIGLGFAFTENIFYFGEFYDQLGTVFQARAIENPFVHPLSTALTGAGVGFASQARSWFSVIPMFSIGYAGAVILHGLHNFSAIQDMGSAQRLAYQLPVYAAAVILICYLRVRERRRVLDALAEYAQAGWITGNEMAMIQSVANREAAVRWAGERVGRSGGNPNDGIRAMRRFQEELLDLANTRVRVLHRGTVNRPEVRVEEARRLELLRQLREVLTGFAVQPAGTYGY
ncbi:MAG: PrsW family intramembrane metalloprotease [Ancrocorticia sp.]|uniref:PrsW family intramembrane metalloprotease n=1 Tax=Ancrocorticia sp. TaxID=2593684 RepID=UPI003F93E1B4